MDWKSVLEKSAVTVLSTIVLGALGLIYVYVTAPLSQPVTAIMETLDVENPLVYVPGKVSADIAKMIADNFGGSSPRSELDSISANSKVRIGKIEFKNIGDSISKEIALSSERSIFIVNSSGSQSGMVRGQVTIKPILPSKSVTVHFIENGVWLIRPDIVALHDSKRVKVVDATWSEEFIWLSAWIQEYWFFWFLVVGVGVIVLVVGFISLIMTLTVKDMPTFRAKNATPAQVEKEVKFIEAVKRDFPDKMPKDKLAATPIGEDLSK